MVSSKLVRAAAGISLLAERVDLVEIRLVLESLDQLEAGLAGLRENAKTQSQPALLPAGAHRHEPHARRDGLLEPSQERGPGERAQVHHLLERDPAREGGLVGARTRATSPRRSGASRLRFPGLRPRPGARRRASGSRRRTSSACCTLMREQRQEPRQQQQRTEAARCRRAGSPGSPAASRDPPQQRGRSAREFLRERRGARRPEPAGRGSGPGRPARLRGASAASWGGSAAERTTAAPQCTSAEPFAIVDERVFHLAEHLRPARPPRPRTASAPGPGRRRAPGRSRRSPRPS